MNKLSSASDGIFFNKDKNLPSEKQIFSLSSPLEMKDVNISQLMIIQENCLFN